MQKILKGAVSLFTLVIVIFSFSLPQAKAVTFNEYVGGFDLLKRCVNDQLTKNPDAISGWNIKYLNSKRCKFVYKQLTELKKSPGISDHQWFPYIQQVATERKMWDPNHVEKPKRKSESCFMGVCQMPPSKKQNSETAQFLRELAASIEKRD